MKKTILISAIILSMLGAATASPAHRHSTGNVFNSVIHPGQSESGDSVTGTVSDSHCRFKHMDGMESGEACVQHCLANGAKIILVDAEKNRVYTLDEEGQKLARKFAARRVKVSGHVMDGMIHVESVEAAE